MWRNKSKGHGTLKGEGKMSRSGSWLAGQGMKGGCIIRQLQPACMYDQAGGIGLAQPKKRRCIAARGKREFIRWKTA